MQETITVYTVLGLYRGKFPFFNTVRNIYTFATREDADKFVGEVEDYFKDDTEHSVDTWLVLDEKTETPRDALRRHITMQLEGSVNE